MKIKEKLFILTGSNTKKIYHETNMTDCFVAKETLKNFVDVIELGDQELGFDHNELSTIFCKYIKDEDQPINIILNAHGSFKNDLYHISTSGTYRDQELVKKQIECLNRNNDISKQQLEAYRLKINIETKTIEAKNLIGKLISLAGNHPLKILALCCYGENFLDFVDLLPPGSFIITLSNRDTVTSFSSFLNEETETILNDLFTNKFRIEYLVEAFLLSQNTQQNTPKIGIKPIRGESIIIDIADYVQNLPLPIKFSSIFTHLLHKNGIEECYIVDKLAQLQEEKNINNYKVSPEEYQKIVEFRDGFLALSKKPDNDGIVGLIAKYYPFLSSEKISNNVSQSEKDELQVSTFIKFNPTPIESLKIMDSVDFHTTHTKTEYMPLYNILLALASDVMVAEDYIMGQVLPDLELI